MSLDAHNLILPGANRADAGFGGGTDMSEADQAAIKSRFDAVMNARTPDTSEASAVTPAEIPNDASNPVVAVTPVVPATGQSAAQSSGDEDATVPAGAALIDMLAQAVYGEPAQMPAPGQMPFQVVDVTVAAGSDLPDTAANVAAESGTASDAPTQAAPSKMVQTLMEALKAAQANKSETTTSEATKSETTPPESAIPAEKAQVLDLAAVLMAAQQAQSAQAEASETEAFGAEALLADAELDALLKTLPPELQALLQANAAPASPAGGQAKAANLKAAPPEPKGQSLTDKAFAGLSADATAASDDQALSAVKDVTAANDGAEPAAGSAQTAAASAQSAAVPATANEAQNSTQALLNSLSSRLNGATAASSASTAATAQAYVMSNQTADNIAALAAHISKKMDGKTLRFDMELRPSDMGRVDVRMEINADGKLSAHLSFDSPVAESEFRGRQDDLRRQLEQSGFNLEDGSLSFSSRDQNPQQSGRDAQSHEHDKPAVTASAASAQFSRTEDTADDLALSGWIPGMEDMAGRLSLNVRV